MPRDIALDLRHGAVTRLTRDRYNEAFDFFTQFLRIMERRPLSEFSTDAEVDSSLAEYVQFIFSHYCPKFCGFTVYAAVLDRFPRTRCPTVRRMLKAWDRHEPATSAWPIPRLIAIFVIHEVILGNNFGKREDFEVQLQLSCTALLLYFGLFRPSEIRPLTAAHVAFGPNGASYVRVRGKTEVRHNRPHVVVTVQDSFLAFLLRALISQRGDQPLFCLSSNTFTRFCNTIHETFPWIPRVLPYSWKRGGASNLFQRIGAYDPIVEKGRWNDVGSARRYIDSAAADTLVTAVPARMRPHLDLALQELRQLAGEAGVVGSEFLADLA